MAQSVKQLIGVEYKLNAETGKQDPHLNVVQETLDMIKAFPSPLHVVAITGPARLGKSTLNNIILRKYGVTVDAAQLFDASAGNTTVTAGVWAYPYPIALPGGGSLLLIDTEGTERGDDTVTLKLTALTCYFSSLLVLHVSNNFSNTQMDQLTRMQGLIDIVRGDDHERVAPKLLVVSRDIADDWIELELGESADTADLSSPAMHARLDGVLNNELQDKDNQRDRNQIRAIIRTWFAQRHYQTLVTAERADRAKLKTFTYDPTTLFGKSMSALLQRIEGLSEEKRMDGQAIDATLWCRLFAQIVDTANRAAISLISVLYEVHLQRGLKLAEELMAPFKAKINAATTIAEVGGVFQAESAVVHTTFANRVKELNLTDGAAVEAVQKQMRNDMENIRLLRETSIQAELQSKMRQEIQDLENDSKINKENAEANQKKVLELNKVLLDNQKASEKLNADVAALQQRNAQLAQEIQAARSSGGGCFVGSCLVRRCTDDKLIPISDVCIGDMIETFNEKKKCIEPSKVWYVGQYNTGSDSSVISLYVDNQPNPLALTLDHLVFVRKNSSFKPRRANKVVIGDTVLLYNQATKQTKEAVITNATISSAPSHVYSVLTLNDTIVVSGVVSSCYERHHRIGKVDNMLEKMMFKVAPKVVQSSTFRRYSDFFDNVFYSVTKE